MAGVLLKNRPLNFKLKVLLDTNTFLYSVRYGINVYNLVEDALLAKCEFLTLKRVIEELEEIVKKGGFKAKIASKAIEYALMKCKIIDFKVEEVKGTDKLIIEYVKRNPKDIVITNDRDLRRRLRKAGIAVGYIDLESKTVKVEGLYF